MTATTSRGAAPRFRLAARLLLVAIVLATPVGAGLLLLDFMEVRTSLREARAALNEVSSAIGEVDAAEARTGLADADASLAAARSRTSRPLWSLASVTPVIRHSVTATRDVVEAASTATEIVEVAVTDGEQLMADGLDVVVVDGTIDLEPLLAAHDLVAGLPIDRLEASRQRLVEPLRGWVPNEIREGRLDTLEMTDELLGTVTRARSLTSALPGFFGADEPRRYLVGMQTSAELRGTGGLLNFYGVLEIDDGTITFGQSDTYDPLDETTESDETRTRRLSEIGGPIDVGVKTDPEYEARYARQWGTSSFSNVNLDPDLPTTARVALDLYALRTQQRLDGLILLDPPGLQRLLEATGPTLPLDDAIAAELDLGSAELPADEFTKLVTVDIYTTHGQGRHRERAQVLRQLGDAAFLRVLDGGWDAPEMARAVVDAVGHRHLQVFSENESEQAAFVDVGVAGALEPSETSDLLAVTANNAVGGKQDVHLGHEFEVDVRLGSPGRTTEGELVVDRDMTVAVTVDNPLPDSGMDDYIIGSCYVPGGRTRCFEGPRGLNRTMFSAWLPEGTVVADTEPRGSGDAQLHSVPAPYRGFTVVDHAHITTHASRESFDLKLGGWAPLQQGRDGLIYEWSWWRQAKAIPDLLDVTVHAPEGWQITALHVEGGGGGIGMGVHGQGASLTTQVNSSNVRVTGTVSKDLHVKLELGQNSPP